MTTDPQATPTSATPASPVVDASPQGPAATAPLPLPGEAVSSEAAPASSPARPTRAEWVRIAIFGIPYAVFFLVGVPTWIFPASWSLTAINIGLDTILLIMALAFFGREFFPAFTYLRTRPVRKIAILFGLWFLVTAIQAASRIALYGHNQPIAENQQQVINAIFDGGTGLVFCFFVAIGVPMVEEIFYRHILIGKLSAYAPTWLVASFSAALFAYMHCHQWQDFFTYLPLSIVLTLVYVMSGKNVAYSWLFHALNNSIMVGLMFAMQGVLQNV